MLSPIGRAARARSRPRRLTAFLEEPRSLACPPSRSPSCLLRDPAPALTRLAAAVDLGWVCEESVHALALAALATQLPGGTNPFDLQA